MGQSFLRRVAHYAPGAEAIASAFYTGPAKQQKDAFRRAGQESSDLGRTQRDWYDQAGKTAINYYGGNDSPPPAYGAAPVKALGAPPAANPRIPEGITPVGSPPPSGPAGPTFNDPVSGGGSSYGGGGGYTVARNEPTKTPTADDALNSLVRNRPVQNADFYDTMQMPGARPTQQQGYYDYMAGRAGKQTNQEELYNARRGGNDPAAQYQDDRAVDAINRAMAARGGFNSGNARRGITDYYANANAQRSRDLASLAGGADSSRLGLDNSYGVSANGASGEQRGYYSDLGGAADRASKEQSDYFGDVNKGAFDLSKAKADLSARFAENGGRAFTEGELAKIEAELAAAGVDAATIRAFIGDVKAFGSEATKVATAVA